MEPEVFYATRFWDLSYKNTSFLQQIMMMTFSLHVLLESLLKTHIHPDLTPFWYKTIINNLSFPSHYRLNVLRMSFQVYFYYIIQQMSFLFWKTRIKKASVMNAETINRHSCDHMHAFVCFSAELFLLIMKQMKN